jgi:ActR/RegA family two-component response regulator
MNPASSAFVGKVLLVSNDATAIMQLTDSPQRFALFAEQSSEASSALERLNRAKFEAVIVDLKLGSQAETVLDGVRNSPSNKHAVVFTVTDSEVKTTAAFRAGSTFILRRPLSAVSIDLSLKAAFGLIVRERRRYFRCPVDVPVAILRTALPIAHGYTVNVSEGGMSIATPISLRPVEPVELQFTLPGDEFQFVLESRVCWAKEQGIGLQFTSSSLHRTAKLQQWLSRRLEETIPQSVRDKFSKLPQD